MCKLKPYPVFRHDTYDIAASFKAAVCDGSHNTKAISSVDDFCIVQS